MADASIPEMKDAIRGLYGGEATWVRSQPVKQTSMGKPLWEGFVHTFKLAGHHAATMCYAWSFDPGEGEPRRVVAVLHQGEVNSPITALRHAISRGRHERKG
jgi:hypothetical protein